MNSRRLPCFDQLISVGHRDLGELEAAQMLKVNNGASFHL